MSKAQFLKVRAEIDEFSGGSLSGWFVTKDLENSENKFTLLVDDEFAIPGKATNYRPDLDALGVLNGLAGFRVPLYITLLDDKKHSIKIIDSDGKILARKKIKLSKTVNMLYLENSILSIQKKSFCSPSKNLVYIACYAKKKDIPKFILKLVYQLKKANYTVIFILAVDKKLEKDYINIDSIDADIAIKRKNIGYDFGSWSSAILLTRNLLFQAENVLFINDSIIGPFFNLSNIVASFENSKGDIWGVCDSFDHRHHLQSYFFGFHKAILCSPHLDSFFLHENPAASDRNEAVENYELSLLEYFRKNNFNYETHLGYAELLANFHKNASKMLSQFKVDKVNDSFYRDKNSDLSMTVQPVSYLVNTLSEIENSTPLNPSHYFSHEILEAGFPFIKKELLFKNPVNNYLIAYNQGINLDSDTNCLIEDVFIIEDAVKYPSLINIKQKS